MDPQTPPNQSTPPRTPTSAPSTPSPIVPPSVMWGKELPNSLISGNNSTNSHPSISSFTPSPTSTGSNASTPSGLSVAERVATMSLMSNLNTLNNNPPNNPTSPNFSNNSNAQQQQQQQQQRSPSINAIPWSNDKEEHILRNPSSHSTGWNNQPTSPVGSVGSVGSRSSIGSSNGSSPQRSPTFNVGGGNINNSTMNHGLSSPHNSFHGSMQDIGGVGSVAPRYLQHPMHPTQQQQHQQQPNRQNQQQQQHYHSNSPQNSPPRHSPPRHSPSRHSPQNGNGHQQHGNGQSSSTFAQHPMRIFCLLVDSNGKQLHSGQAFRIPAGASLTLRDVKAQVIWALGLNLQSERSNRIVLKLRHPKHESMTFLLQSNKDVASLNDNDVVIAQDGDGLNNGNNGNNGNVGHNNSTNNATIVEVNPREFDVFKPTIIVASAASQMLPAADIVGQLVIRVKARQTGDFQKADRIRNELIRSGIHVADRAGHITAAAPTKQGAYDAALAAARVLNASSGSHSPKLLPGNSPRSPRGRASSMHT